jgi:DNA-binding NarL/FixJ family response regulator
MVDKKHRVFLVDDHPIVRQGLSLLIDHQPDLMVCGMAADTRSAMTDVPGSKPDIVVADLSMPGPDGLELIKSLRALLPGLPVLVLSMHDETLYAERVLKAGARGYVMKHEAETNIINALRRILDGSIYLSPAMTNRLLRKVSDHGNATPPSGIATLSDRELQIFEMLGHGLRPNKIAKELGIGIKTVETHVGRIRAKLGLRHAHEVLREAVLWLQQPAAQ